MENQAMLMNDEGLLDDTQLDEISGGDWRVTAAKVAITVVAGLIQDWLNKHM